MGQLKGLWRKAALAALAGVIAAPTLALPAHSSTRPPAATSAPQSIPPLFGPEFGWLHDLILEAPYGERFLDDLEAQYQRAVAQQDGVVTDRFAYGVPISDMNRDGHGDVLIVDITVRIEYDAEAFSTTFSTSNRFTALNGRTGKKMWSHAAETENGFVVAVDTKVGRKANNGLMFVRIEWGDDFFGDGYARVIITPVEGVHGHVLWEKTFTPTVRQDASVIDFTTVAHDAPVSIYLFNGVKGKATDVLVGVGTIVTTLATTLSEVGAVVVDGRDGSENKHLALESGVDWLPYPRTVGDFDNDGLDDYFVINKNQLVVREPGSGEPGDSDIEVSDIVRARKGTDGSELWLETDVDIGWYAWEAQLHNSAGVRGDDLGVMTWIYDEPPLPLLPILFPDDYPLVDRVDAYLMEGSSGSVQWRRPGEYMTNIGDIDNDGFNDVVTNTSASKKRNGKQMVELTLRAFDIAGHRLYLRVHRERSELQTCPANKICYSYGFADAGGIGDIQPDAHPDLGGWLYIGQQIAKPIERHFIIDGTTGKNIRELDEWTWWEGLTYDGAGVDLTYTRWTEEEGGHLVGIDGRDMSKLWDVRAQSEKPLLPRQAWFFGWPGRLDKDACNDVVINFATKTGTQFAVMDGGTTEILWRKRVFGDDAPLELETKDLDPACG